MGFSLTIMIVMYTMYQSISADILKTAYLKMIDVWLIFCLSVPFVVFMIQISWKLTKTTKTAKVLDVTAISHMRGWSEKISEEKTDCTKCSKCSYRKNFVVWQSILDGCICDIVFHIGGLSIVMFIENLHRNV